MPIEIVSPLVDDGRYPVKISITRPLIVRARIILPCQGTVWPQLRIKTIHDDFKCIIPMVHSPTGEWSCQQTLNTLGCYTYSIQIIVDNEVNEQSREIPFWIERERTTFGNWYERFPRSCSDQFGKHSTFKDFKNELKRIAELGFDVIYIPPIHPIGTTNRKGKNGNASALPFEPGSPWAIGSSEGGHKTIAAEYGSLEDFRDVIEYSQTLGIEICLDIALHCSPDHPYIQNHPEWFIRDKCGELLSVKDGSVEYADIVPFNFDCTDEQGLWNELKSIFNFWIKQGVILFRIDNPHTKPLRFWEWLIRELKADHPEIILLSEALTQPKTMHDLSKIGMSQSYDYFQWKVTKQEIVSYYSNIYSEEIDTYFRPVLWTNTPQNLPLYLQGKNMAAFTIRLILAGTLGSNYGIYGPAFEFCQNTPLKPGFTEYDNSEQFEIPCWQGLKKYDISDWVKKLNKIRKENDSFHNNISLRFHPTDNDKVIAFSKYASNPPNYLITIISLDPENRQTGSVYFQSKNSPIQTMSRFIVYDLLYEKDYAWNNCRNYFELSPDRYLAHILKVNLPNASA
jgi:starch synthase (maltosyl-transferring)